MTVPFHRPWILEDDVARVADTLRSGWLTSGPRVEEVEIELCRLTGAKHALAMSSCTAALHAAVARYRPRPTDRVIVPDFTFAATATAIFNAGAIPLLCDVDSDSGGLDPEAIEHLLLARRDVIGIVAVHYAGIPCDVAGLRGLARRHGVFLVEDAAHALGTAHPDGGKVGSAAEDGAALSFYATKNATSAEGGALLTDDDELAEFARRFRYHGLTRIAWEREGSPLGATYDVADAGFKYNLSDLAASLLLGQLRRFEEGQRLRRAVAARYIKAFWDLPVHCMGADARGHAWHLFVLRSNRALELGEHLISRGIGARHHYRPLHELTFLRSDPAQYPRSLSLSRSVISLPIYPDLSENEQCHVIDAVREFFRG